ncbi:hypothetical protein [Deminuibacter soli]|uniref:Outer membrane protein beta-barrel domain-containing protein n=1 Tax=Deminuibacter soli TaxID=2291815 RepID=A0A3E1NHM0_9BACT|nr:hypothetical protein [Deminuibacter soli]RFM27407.1 hypothetical protein DXN05_15420 [Deminuibacter soli]
MKSLLAILALLLTAGINASAQFYDKPSHVSLEVQGVMPMGGYFAQSQKTGGGAAAKLIMPLSESADLVVSGGLFIFPGKMVPRGKTMINAGYLKPISLLAGFRYSFTPTDVLYDDEAMNTFYIEPRLGFSVIRSKSWVPTYAPTIGYLIRDKVDISFRYQATSSSNKYNQEAMLVFGVAYGLDF